jgi:hypothetical protein
VSPDELDQRINAALAPLRQELRELRLELNQLKQMAGLSAQEQSPSGRSESFQQGLTLSGPYSAASGETYASVSGTQQSQSGRSESIEQDQTLSGPYSAASGETYASVSGTQQSQSGRSQSFEQTHTQSGTYPAVSGGTYPAVSGGGGIWSRLLGLPAQAPFLQRFQQSVQLIQQESIPSRPAAFAAVELIELVEEEKRQSDLDLPFFSHWDELEPQLLALVQLESLLPQPGESYRSPEQVVVRTARGGQRDTIERCLRCGFRFQGQLLRKAEVSIFV